MGYTLAFMPLIEADGDQVGQMGILADYSKEFKEARWTIYFFLLVAAGIGGMSFIFFYWFVGRVNVQIKGYQEMLRKMAVYDDLTGLYNYRSFLTILISEIERVKRYNNPLSLLMLDIDHFKQINDTHGHLAGNKILKFLSSAIMEQGRAIDSVCRYGGEELAIILPNTSMDDAIHIAERLRSTVEKVFFEIGAEKPVHITVSIGVASVSGYTATENTLIRKADNALYEAKEKGRNRVCCYKEQGCDKT